MIDRPIIAHTDVRAFAECYVNLRREDAKEYRDQVNRLREKLEQFIKDHPDYGLVKMLLSGSLAKGTALRTINDVDIAIYIKEGIAPTREKDLLDWLADKLRQAYPQMRADQIRPCDHCVRISFCGTGLDVDVVPVHYEGDPDWRGYLVERQTGKRVLTSIPMHLSFIRKRKDAQPDHFAQVVRLVKWWVKQRKADDESFRFKSFMVEMVVAHVADGGCVLSDYPLALERVFAYIVKSGMKQRIAFSDYYPASELPPPTGEAIEVFDPVNARNNAAVGYSQHDRAVLVDKADDALSAIAEAAYATTKERAVECWQIVFGPSFRG